MDFIFMLTRQDRTVTDAERVLAEVFALGVRHIGFKDIGVDRTVLDRLNRTIKQDGGTSYMEVVSTTPEACLASARVAAESGVETPTIDNLIRLDRARKGKKLSNADWTSPTYPDAKIARMTARHMSAGSI